MMINMDLIIVGVFLVITLTIGLYYGRGITTFEDYAVGNRKMSTTVITFSLIATIYGGRWLDFKLHDYYFLGYYACIIELANFAVYYVSNRCVIVRMKEFVGHLSIAESMGSIYGPTVRLITAIFGIMKAITLITVQIKIGLTLAALLCPAIKQFSTYLTPILALIVIGYSTFGGARAVALTDVCQFFLFGLCLPMLIFVFLYYAKDPLAGWQKLGDMPQFNIGKVLTVWNNTVTRSLWQSLHWFVIIFAPERMQRFYMASSVQQAVTVFNRTAMTRMVFGILFLSTAMALYIGSHAIEPNQNVLHYMLKLAYFPGMQGVLVTAIIALMMSTADSNLHAASVLFANDLWPIMVSSAKRVSRPSLKIVRIASVVIGIMSLFTVWHTANLILLVRKIAHFYLPVVSVPFLMTCFGFRPRAVTILLTMSINIAIAVYRIFSNTISEAYVFTPLICSALMLLTIHYLLPKRPNTGWVGIKDRSAWDLQNQESKRWWRERLQQLTIPFTRRYRANLFPKKESTFILLGVYVIISTIIALFFMQKAYVASYVYWYMAVMAIGTILALYPALHSYQQGGNPRLHWVWIGLLFVLLFVSNIQWAKLGHFSPMVCALFVSNIALSIVLLSVEISIGMLGVAMIMHRYIPPNIPFWDLCSANYQAISIEPVYAMALGGASVVGFLTYKRLRDKADAKLKVIELTKTYEHRIALEAIYNQANWSRLDMTYGSKLLQEMSKMLQAPYHYLHTHGQIELGEVINNFMQKLDKFSHLLLQKTKAERGLELDQKEIKRVAIEPVIAQVHQYIRGVREPIQLLVRNQTGITALLADPVLFECFLILNLWEASKCAQAVDHMVTLTMADTTLHYATTQADQAALTLPALAFCISTDTGVQNVLSVYHVTDELMPTYLPKTVDQVYQVESRQIVQAHGGYTEITENESVLTCLYVLPVAGTRVMHFKTYDPVDLVAGKVAETAESLTQEKELVTLLTTETALTQEVVEKTVMFIKHAHGLVTRKSGDPYYTHPMMVAKMLLEVTKDPSTILAGLLHDVVEDTPVTLNQVELMYGPEVASIVDRVTHYNTNGYRWKLEDEENKNMLDQCKDIRVVQVKLADRLHNIQTLHARKVEDQKRVAKDTIKFYIPLGKKYNISSKWLAEMQQICEEILV